MKTIYWIFIFFVGITKLYAQDADNQILDGVDTTSLNEINEKENMIIGCHPEIFPTFKGGREGLQEYLNKNAYYPKTATKSGTVYVQFTVEKDGKVTNVAVLKGLEPILDNEALRVIRMMPAWIPATIYGKPTAMKYNLPIKFSVK
jgi:protein TonB